MKLNLLTANSDISIKQDCTGPSTEHHLHINTEEMIIDQLESRHLLTHVAMTLGQLTLTAHLLGTCIWKWSISVFVFSADFEFGLCTNHPSNTHF